jgi:hypothetical protein
MSFYLTTPAPTSYGDNLAQLVAQLQADQAQLQTDITRLILVVEKLTQLVVGD